MKWRRGSHIGLGLVALATLGANSADPAGEYRVKSAFLVNFIKFVEWPSAALGEPSQPIVVRVVGRSYADVIEAALKDKAAKERPILVRRQDDGQPTDDCHVLFVMADASQQLRPVLRELGRKPVLTVSEIDEPDTSPAVLNFVPAGTRLAFTVNLDSADSAGLQVSSKLLALAQSVRSSRLQRK